MQLADIGDWLSSWLPDLGARIVFTVALSAIIYIGLITMMTQVYRRLGARLGTIGTDFTTRGKRVEWPTRLSVLTVLVLADLALIIPQITSDPGLVQPVLDRLLHIATIAAAAFIVYNLAVISVAGLQRAVSDEDDSSTSAEEQRAKTIGAVIRSAAAAAIISVAAMMVMEALGIAIAPVLAGAGIAGIALGLGAQVLVKDIISGLSILIEDEFRVDDVVQIGDFSGTVERMTLRSTWLRGIDGTLQIVPNGEIRAVSNRSRSWSRSILRIRIPYDEDIEKAERILNQLATEIVKEEPYAEVVQEEPSVLAVSDFGESWITLMILLRTKALKHFGIERDLRKRIVKAFTRENVKFAYPHSVVHLAQNIPPEEPAPIISEGAG